MIVVAEITKDHLYDPSDNFPSRVGEKWELEVAAPKDPKDKLPFKLFDDDGELYYEGWLFDIYDYEYDLQYDILKWAERDAGCTTIKIKKNGEWIQEIG